MVGAGAAGLAACRELRRRGVDAVLYEGAARTGGRCRSGLLGDVVIDRGAAFIDSHHSVALALAEKYQLDVVDLEAAEEPNTRPLFRVSGKAYDWESADRDFAPLLRAVQRDYRMIQTPRGADFRAAIDRTSVADYLGSLNADVSESARSLMSAALQWEQAADPGELSALTLLYSLGTSDPDSFSLLGASDTRYTLRRGMQSLTDAMTAELEPWIETNHRLVSASQSPAGVTLIFERTGTASRTIKADAAILATPFSVLREGVNLTGADLPEPLSRAIAELGYGRSTKVHINLRSNPWRGTTWNGSIIDTDGLQSCWDGGQASGTERTVLVNLTAGSGAVDQSLGGDIVAARLAAEVASVCNTPVEWAGDCVVDQWHSNEWAKGSYAFFRPGQWTAFGDVVRSQVGAIRFAGEHTSPFSGGVNGALRSGIRAARDLIDQ